jgi:hypothetical protein
MKTRTVIVLLFLLSIYSVSLVPQGNVHAAMVETTKIITHGLGQTPNLVAITPTSYPGSYVFYYVDTITATTFTLHLIAEDGVTVTFMWKAEKI